MTENELCILRNLIIKMSFQEAFLRRAPWHKVPQAENVRTKVCGSDSEANTCPRGSKNKTAARNRKVSESGDTRLSREENPRSSPKGVINFLLQN